MMKLAAIRPLLRYSFKSDHELISSIEELSRKFTTERTSISDYLKDERLASAYTAFYLTTNIPKLEAAYRWLPTAWLTQLKQCSFIDLGAGPGTFSIAFRQWLGTAAKTVIQIETSAVMQEQARVLWQGLFPGEEVKLWSRAQSVEGEKLLCFGHSANEMGAAGALEYIRQLNPEHLLFIEPGTKTFFPEMLKIRQQLISDGYHVLYPCPDNSLCPMSNGEDWCHQYLHVTQDPEVERLSQMARKDRRHLPIIVHAYSKTFQTTNPRERVVRVFPETKFSFEWELCHSNQLERVQVMKRGLDKTGLKDLEAITAGDAIVSETDKQLEAFRRIKLICKP